MEGCYRRWNRTTLDASVLYHFNGVNSTETSHRCIKHSHRSFCIFNFNAQINAKTFAFVL